MNEGLPLRGRTAVRWAFLLVLNGCASVSILQSAETVGRGRWEVAAEVSSQAQVGTDSLSLYPMGGIAGRYGVTDAFDVGARIGPSGTELNAKVMLTPRTGGAIVSIAPLVAGTFWIPGGVRLGTAQAAIPVLIGIPLSPRLELILAPRVHDSLFFLEAGQAGATVNTFFAGLAVGVAVQLGRFKIIPDVGFLAPLATTTWRYDLPSGTVWGQSRWTAQASVAVILGRAK